MIASKAQMEPGEAYPLGATWDGKGVNFALFSANAERVDLCVFDGRGRRWNAAFAPTVVQTGIDRSRNATHPKQGRVPAEFQQMYPRFTG